MKKKIQKSKKKKTQTTKKLRNKRIINRRRKTKNADVGALCVRGVRCVRVWNAVCGVLCVGACGRGRACVDSCYCLLFFFLHFWIFFCFFLGFSLYFLSLSFYFFRFLVFSFLVFAP